VSRHDIIKAMQEAAPPGTPPGDCTKLAELTAELVAADDGTAKAEHERFLAVRERELPGDLPISWLAGKRVLVTGGTGCVGSALISTIWRYGNAAKLASVSRGIIPPADHGIACYHFADIRDPAALNLVFSKVQPDVVFHVAGQRDPGLAEHEVRYTAHSNVGGTWNVLQAAANHHVQTFVFAGTGKALRPYSKEVYTASKRVAEWVVAQAAIQNRKTMACAGVRFTHVVDNSIIYNRLQSDALIRIHEPTIGFYVQSAAECASLLLLAGQNAQPGEFRIHTITNLDWPISLLDLAISIRAFRDDRSVFHFSGYDPGYEKAPYPGLYDPDTAGDVSPLLNLLEAREAVHDEAHGTDSFPVRYTSIYATDALVGIITDAATEAVARDRLDVASMHVLRSTMREQPQSAVRRMADIAEGHPLLPCQMPLANVVRVYAGYL
jgi:nucleoside-diphosphate-sugar epimerase